MPTPRQIVMTYRLGTGGVLPPPPSGIPSLQGLALASDEPEIKNFSYLATGITGMNTKVPQTFVNGTGRYLLATYDNWGVGWNPNYARDGSGTGPLSLPPNGGSWDNPNLNSVTWDCALSTMDGTTFYPGKFVRIVHANGTVEELIAQPSTVSIEGGAYAVALFDLTSSKSPGVQLMEHAFVSCASGAMIWRHKGDLGGVAGQTVTASNGETSKVDQMFVGSKPAVAGGDGSGAWSSSMRHMDAPPAQLVRPTCVNGDSLTAGPYVWRQFLRANHIPHIHLGRGTETARNFLLNDSKSVYRRRLGALGGFTRGIVQYGTNDLTLNSPTQTLTIFQSNWNALVAMQKGWGAGEVMIGTLPPNNKSSDGFTSLANQTLDMSSSGRGKNEQLLLDGDAWLCSGTPYGSVTPQAWHHSSGFYVADWGGAETIMDTSPGDTPSTIAKWKINGGAHTVDGLHPGTAVGIAEGLPAIPFDLFQNTGG